MLSLLVQVVDLGDFLVSPDPNFNDGLLVRPNFEVGGDFAFQAISPTRLLYLYPFHGPF